MATKRKNNKPTKTTTRPAPARRPRSAVPKNTSRKTPSDPKTASDPKTTSKRKNQKPTKTYRTTPKSGDWNSLPKHGTKILIAAAVVSLLLHIGSGIRLAKMDPGQLIDMQTDIKKPVKIKIVQKKKKKEQKQPEPDKKIIETPQLPTEKPDDARYLGPEDHVAKKEQKSKPRPQDNTAEAGRKSSNKTKKQTKTVQATKPKTKKRTNIMKKSARGQLAMGATELKRKAYESILPTDAKDLLGQYNAGYEDYINDDLDEGDYVDLNTTKYRYIGYMSNFRKQLFLVWNYPHEAARKNFQGVVELKFKINKRGHARNIKVTKSSGYEILDRAIVDAIRKASPFAPLPEGFGKKELPIKGSFHYVLNAFGAH